VPELLRIDHTTLTRESHLDGDWPLRRSDLRLSPDDLAVCSADTAISFAAPMSPNSIRSKREAAAWALGTTLA
jgi:hypothetical protein